MVTEAQICEAFSGSVVAPEKVKYDWRRVIRFRKRVKPDQKWKTPPAWAGAENPRPAGRNAAQNTQHHKEKRHVNYSWNI